MFLPVGSTAGLRMGSPPGPGSLSATTWRRQNSRYSKSGVRAASPAADAKPVFSRAVRQGADGRARRLRDLLEELDVAEDALVGVAVDLLELAALGVGEDAGEAEDVVLGAVDLRDGHERRDGLLGRRRHADRVEAHGQEAALDLHEAAVDGADDVVAGLEVDGLGVEVVRGQVLDVLVEVARVRRGDDGVDDGRAARLVLAEALVGRHELRELLQALVEARVLRGGREVRDRRRVGPALRDGRLRRVVRLVLAEA